MHDSWVCVLGGTSLSGINTQEEAECYSCGRRASNILRCTQFPRMSCPEENEEGNCNAAVFYKAQTNTCGDCDGCFAEDVVIDPYEEGLPEEERQDAQEMAMTEIVET